MAPPTPAPIAALPAKFQCRICGENKAASAYSMNQIQKWYNKKKNDRFNKITPENIGLICKDHASREQELRCHGPCDRVKAMDSFSKAQRNNPDPWCIACTEWRIKFDGLEVPIAMRNGGILSSEAHSVENDSSPTPEEDHDNKGTDEDSTKDGTVALYNGLASVTGKFDRLHGYDGADQGKDDTPDGASTKDGAAISLWDGTDTNPGQLTRSRNYASATNNTAVPKKLDVPRHLNRFTSLQDMNQKSPYHQAHEPALVAWPTETGEGLQLNEADKTEKALAIVDTTFKSGRANGKDKKKNKWHVGSSRKVYHKERTYFTNEAQDRTEVVHDSDSSDEM
ncbi:hypothetical protein GGS21DRAFT_486955 [Xylaria nigripes]|nr:hypothetical protein GGS21DRAFT_486955 [Xylaria nigripes]